MKTSTILTTLLLLVGVIPTQAQLFAPEVNVQVMPDNRVELQSDLFFLEPGVNTFGQDPYILADGNAQLKVLNVTHRGDNSFLRFETPLSK